MTIIFSVFAGRQRFLSILLSYVEPLLDERVVDRLDLWDFCRLPSDRVFLQSLQGRKRTNVMAPSSSGNGTKFLAYYVYYMQRVQDSDVLIKCDDDIIFIANLPALLHVVHADNGQHLLYLPSIVNHDVSAFFQAADGVIDDPEFVTSMEAPSPSRFRSVAYDRPPISDWSKCARCAQYVHSRFLAHPDAFFTFCAHEVTVPCRVPINLFAMRGDAVRAHFAAYAREAGRWDDEPFLSSRLSELTGLRSLIVSSCVAAHFSFGFQMMSAERAGSLLAQYRALSRDANMQLRLRSTTSKKNLSQSCPSSAPAVLQQGLRRHKEPPRVAPRRGLVREVLYTAAAAARRTPKAQGAAWKWRDRSRVPHPQPVTSQLARPCARHNPARQHNSSQQRLHRESTVEAVLVVARHNHNQDVSWLRNASHPVHFIDKGDVTNLGEEGSSYLSFIVTQYENLPRWVLFMTAHERHWHHALASQACSACIDMAATGLDFLNINHDRSGRMLVLDKPRGQPAELPLAVHARLRRDLLGLHTPYDGSQRMPPSAQFWVSRERILARPRAYYQTLLDVLEQSNHPLMAASAWYWSRRLWGFFMEAYWHYILGECEFYSLPFLRYRDLPLRQAASCSSATS